jgi:hypothetical protein
VAAGLLRALLIVVSRVIPGRGHGLNRQVDGLIAEREGVDDFTVVEHLRGSWH